MWLEEAKRKKEVDKEDESTQNPTDYIENTTKNKSRIGNSPGLVSIAPNAAKRQKDGRKEILHKPDND